MALKPWQGCGIIRQNAEGDRRYPFFTHLIVQIAKITSPRRRQPSPPGKVARRKARRMRGPTLSWERVAGPQALTGVGTYPLLGEGGRALGPDGCGARPRTVLVPPLFRRCGGTFPQGKVRELAYTLKGTL